MTRPFPPCVLQTIDVRSSLKVHSLVFVTASNRSAKTQNFPLTQSWSFATQLCADVLGFWGVSGHRRKSGAYVLFLIHKEAFMVLFQTGFSCLYTWMHFSLRLAFVLFAFALQLAASQMYLFTY